jgi:chemotaxis protein MotB
MRYDSTPYNEHAATTYYQPPRPSAWKPWTLFVLTLGGACYGAYWGWGERGKLLAELEQAKGAAEVATTTSRGLAQKVADLEKEKADLVADRESLTRDVQAKAGEIAELKGTYDKLQEKMKDEIARGDIQLTNDGGRLRVGLVDKILFESGEAKVSKRGEEVLARVGAILAPIEDRAIQVSGHTDKFPISEKLQSQFPTNWELSSARATNVVRFLAETAKVPSDRLVASGYGEHRPIASNKTAKGRARNRRIEILLTPSLAPKRISKSDLREAHEAEPVAARTKRD